MSEHTGCEHPLDEHKWARMVDLDYEGGLVVCRPGCPCVDTWAAEGHVPPDYGEHLPELREMVWGVAEVREQLDRLQRGGRRRRR